MVEKSIVEKINLFRTAIQKEGIRISNIILFGSFVAGTNHDDSDIDIAVVSPDFGRDRFEEGVKLFRIACEIDPRIEPIPLSLASYQNDMWVPLIYEIRKNGVEVGMS